MDERAGHSREAEDVRSTAAPSPASDRERILLLECRLEQFRSALEEARANADNVRASLAEASAREADHARRYGLLQQELADARAEIATLHERLGHSEALRAELEGHLFEAGERDDASELVRLRREVLAQRQRSLNSERALSRLRARMDGLLLSREAILARVAEWQRLVRKEGPEAADLAEFISELRRDIMQLERQNAAGERQEAALRERLAQAGLDSDGPDLERAPTDQPSEASEPSQAAGGDVAPPPKEFPRDGRASEAKDPAEEDVAGAEPAREQTAGKAAPPQEPSAEEAGRAQAAGEPRAGERTTAEEPATEQEARSAESTVREEERPSDPEPEPALEAPLADDNISEASEPSFEAAPAEKLPEEGPTPETDDPAPAQEPAHRTAASETGGQHPERAVGAEKEDRTTDWKGADTGDLFSQGRDASSASPFPVEGMEAEDPKIRAAAYERLPRLLADSPERLEEALRQGLADPDARVRRRTVLAATAARGVDAWMLVHPLQEDPDPNVKRLVEQVIRHTEASRGSEGSGRATEERTESGRAASGSSVEVEG